MLTTVGSLRVPRPLLSRYAFISTGATTANGEFTQDENRGTSPNQRFLATLEQAKAEELARPDRSKYKIRSLNKAIKEVGYLDRRLDSPEDVEKLKGVSAFVKRALVSFILSQNSLFSTTSNNDKFPTQTAAQRARDETRAKRVGELNSVPSIGLITARHLVNTGVENIDQLRTVLDLSPKTAKPSVNPSFQPIRDSLTKAQLTNLKYYEDLIQPVNRDEIDRIATLAKELLPSSYEVVCVGAYRRNFPISHRVDLCLFHPLVTYVPKPTTPGPLNPSHIKYHSDRPERRGRIDLAFRSNYIPTSIRHQSLLLNEVVPLLNKGGLIAKDNLAELSKGIWKWAGIVRVPNPLAGGKDVEPRRQRNEALLAGTGTFRKMDLNLVPYSSRATALLFLTGDVEFVREMRMRASRMGLLLNEFGLWRWEVVDDSEESTPPLPPSGSVLRRPARGRPRLSSKSGAQWTLIPTPTETELFSELGMGYIPPDRRNYAYLISRFAKTGVKARRGGERESPMGVVLRS